jgi:hypothetical protein
MPTLPLTIVPQSPHVNWCWAAVTASLVGARGPSVQMCEVVSRTFGPQCCGPTPAACDALQSDLVGPLTLFGILRLPVLGGPPLGVLPFSAPGGSPSVVSEITAGRPFAVGFQIGLRAHFGVVVGFDPIGFVVACDPFFIQQPSAMPYANLLSAYQPGARWVRSYLLR